MHGIQPTMSHTNCCIALSNLLFNFRSLQFVSQFRYQGDIINNEFDDDDDDIKREIRNLFVRTNLLLRRFSKCSVKLNYSHVV